MDGLNGSRVSLSRSVWNWSRRSWMVLASDVPTLPPSLRNSASRPTAAPRSCVGMCERRDIERREDHREAGDHTTRGQTTCHGLMSRFIRDIQ